MSPMSVLADKGEGETKRDGACFVKICAQYNDKRKKIKVTSIGIQSAGNTSVDGALRVDIAAT